MDDYGEETGLTREMKAAADAGPTRSDTDTKWRRGGGGGGGGGASERPRAFGSRGGAGADAIRQAMRGGGGDSGGDAPMRGGAKSLDPRYRSDAPAPMRGGAKSLDPRYKSDAPAPMRGGAKSLDPRYGAPMPPAKTKKGEGMRGGAKSLDPRYGAPMPPAKTKKGEGMKGGAKSLDPRYGAPMPPPKRKSPAAAPPPPPKPAQPYKTREVRGGGFGSVDARKAPAPPAKKAPAAAGAAPAAEEPGEANPDVPARTIDVYWQSYPQETVWTRINRRETKKETKSRMPVVLRNLAPDTAFDPRVMWEKEKERVAEQAAEAKADAIAAKKSGGKKAPKAKKPTKKEEMIAKNKLEQEEKDVRADLEKLENASKNNKRREKLGGVLMATKLATPLGKLRQLLMVLEAELANDDQPAVLDVLWAVEANALYHQALRDGDAGDGGEAAKKGKDKDKKKGGKDDKKKAKPATPAAALVHEFRKEVRAAKKLRKELELAEFQLARMHDRLPPLSRFLKGWRLDAWQKKVLRHIDNGKSAVVCAPTSSGKTVISTYTCVANERVLFVVPTEPLVWQVAAMFEKLLQGSARVALATNQLAYRPSEDRSRVVVGTPLALESSLVKIRGQVGEECTSTRWDYAQLDGGFDFDYAVFDEVHALDGDEGAALQRLVRYVTCPTLALSATIGNAPELRDWWQCVRDDAAPGDAVELVEHAGRFINVQNLVLDPRGQLAALHPCAALKVPQLLGDEKLAFAMTPADSKSLYEALAKAYDGTAGLKPATFFGEAAKREEAARDEALAAIEKRTGRAPRDDPKSDAFKAAASARSRITLDGAKAYEGALKQRLYDEAARDPDALAAFLDSFVPDHLRAAEGADAAASTGRFSILNVATQMRSKLLFPALAFHLDSFRCLALFKSLLVELEEAQDARYPEYSAELQAKADEKQREAEQRQKNAARNEKEAEEAARDGFDDGGDAFVDVSAPHPEFVLAPPTSRLSAKEIDDILLELKRDTQGREELKPTHILVRALRRGFAIYIEDAAFSVYRRVVQRLAQQGKLAIVFSDVSLAYGVNMPFRTVMFCGDEGGLLTPLLAQQMAGRAGRRGLDTQGNLVYLGMTWPRIRRLMVGTVPGIVGKTPHFATMALPLALSDACAANALCATADRPMLQRLCAASLAEHAAGARRTAAESDATVAQALAALEKLDLWVGDAEADQNTDVRPKLCCVWELRDYLPESVALAHALPDFMGEFVKNRFNFKKATEDAGSEAVQIAFFAAFLHIVDRHPCREGATPLAQCTWIQKDAARQENWAKWEKIVAASQARLAGVPEALAGDRDALRLPAHADLDGSVFEIAKDRRMPPASAISSLERHVLKKRLWHVGNVLLKMHNCLQLRGEFIALSPLLRKCFTRVKYILSDDINANVDENAILGERVDSSDDLATMATLEEEASAAVAAQE